MKRRLFIAAAILILLAFLVPAIALPGAKARVVRALEASLGRSVYADSVHLDLLPLPGVELDNVRLGDDPAFGAENMVIADDVIAAVRLRSLLRGKLAFSRVRLDGASINLVRSDQGRWNVAALLERTGASGGSVSAAPRAAAPAPSVRFPYIEWHDARVNFKLHNTKAHFFLGSVNGSLAREAGDWRLQLHFVPLRTDLNLSNTGEVDIDGRWQAGGAGFQQMPLALAVRLQNSYLAGSSALLYGHDAGLHGILSAQLQVSGTAARLQIAGAAQVRSLRRWDLLPPQVTMAAALAAVYSPPTDTAEIIGVGDPGWQHVRLAGTVANLFGNPQAILSLSVNHLAAGDLLPLVMAVKAHVPAGLTVAGELSGAAQLAWDAERAQPLRQGQARFQISKLGLSTPNERLTVPTADLDWNRGALRLNPTHTTLSPTGRHPAALVISARLDRSGFEMDFSSPAANSADASAAADLMGLRSPWPQSVEGKAQMHLSLAAPWAHDRAVAWMGSARFPSAQWTPTGGQPWTLAPLELSFAADPEIHARLTTALDGYPIQGDVVWRHGATPPLQFQLRARRLANAELWRALTPPSTGILQRVLGDVTGGARLPPWMASLHARGTVEVGKLVWHGVPLQLSTELTAAPGAWTAAGLQAQLGGGRFSGEATIAASQWTLTGSVPPSQAIGLGAALQSTPYAGRAGGELSGTLRLARPLDGDWNGLDAAMDFLLRQARFGGLALGRCTGTIHVRAGRGALRNVRCSRNGLLWTGSGTATVSATGTFALQVRLIHGARSLEVTF